MKNRIIEENHFGLMLTCRRKTYGLSQAALAARAGVSSKTVARAERGGNPSAATVTALCNALCLSFDQVTGSQPIDEKLRLTRDLTLTLHGEGISAKRAALRVCREITGEPVENKKKTRPFRQNGKGSGHPRTGNGPADQRAISCSGTSGVGLPLSSIGRRIHTLRRQKRLSQKTLAARCGLTQSALSKIETGKTTPSLGSLSTLAQGLDTTPDTLLRQTLRAFQKIKLRGLINAVLFRLVLMNEAQLQKLVETLAGERDCFNLPRRRSPAAGIIPACLHEKFPGNTLVPATGLQSSPPAA